MDPSGPSSSNTVRNVARSNTRTYNQLRSILAEYKLRIDLTPELMARARALGRHPRVGAVAQIVRDIEDSLAPIPTVADKVTFHAMPEEDIIMVEASRDIRPNGLIVRHFNGEFTISQMTRYQAQNPTRRISVVVRALVMEQDDTGHVITVSLERLRSVWNGRSRLNEVKIDDSDEKACLFKVIGFYTTEIRRHGGCDTHHHTIVQYGAFKVLTLKSKNHNCLVACYAHNQKDKSKHKTIVKKLGLSISEKDNSDIEKLTKHYDLFTRVWIPTDKPTTPILAIGDSSKPIIDIMHHRDHFYYICDGCPVGTGQCFSYGEIREPMKDTKEVLRAAVQPPAETIYDSLESNDFTEIVDKVVNSTCNWYIDGGAGTGKTFLANLIADKIGRDRIAMTATTGIAACRIKGLTIDMFMATASRLKELQCNTVLIDEISMCDAHKMDDIIRFVTKYKVRIILVGDIMQLPPVDESLGAGWFFQSDYLRSNGPIKKVVLRKIRRTNDLEYAELCSRFRVGKPTGEDIRFMGTKYVQNANPENYGLFIASTNDVVNRHNVKMFAKVETTDVVNYPIHLKMDYTPQMVNLDEPAFKSKIEHLNETHNISLKSGVRVLATKNNHEIGYANGMLGEVLECNSEWVRVKFDLLDDAVNVAYITTKGVKKIEYSFMPLKMGYALTVHKAQGLTCNQTMLFDCSNMFAAGMYYTGITRVSCPDLLTLTGDIRNREGPAYKSFKPNKTALKYLSGEYVETMTEIFTNKYSDGENLYYHAAKKIEALNSAKKSPAHPFSAYYYDFETAEGEDGNIKPYQCTYAKCHGASKRENEEMAPTRRENEEGKFDSNPLYKPYEVGYHCDIPGYDKTNGAESVLERTVKDIIDMAMEFDKYIEKRYYTIRTIAKGRKGDVRGSDHYAEMRKGGRSLRTYANDSCPRFAAFNGARFDIWCVADAILNGHYFDSTKYVPDLVMKQGSMVSFRIINRENYCTILKSHDLCQVFPSTLSEACSSLLPEGSKGKIEFKDQIMDISRHRYKDWKSWTNEDWKKPREIEVYYEQESGKPLYQGFQLSRTERRHSIKKSFKYVPNEVIEYSIRDTDVLVELYKNLDVVVKEIAHGLSVWNFITIGSLTWYCAIQEAFRKLKVKTVGRKDSNFVGMTPIVNVTSAEASSSNATSAKTPAKEKPKINLYSCNKPMDDFIREGVYGGRSCPRVIFVEGLGYVYVDISGMYGSIQAKSKLPCGIPSWVEPNQIPNELKKITDFCNAPDGTGKRRDINDLSFTNCPTFWIGRVTFQENQHSLCPVVPMKTKKGTIYTLERRKAVITSLHAAMILLKGGKIYDCEQMIHFSSSTDYCAPWVEKCLEGKSKFKGTPKGSFYKLLANAFFGQCLKQDHKNDYKIVRREDQAINFDQKYDWNFTIVTSGDFDIMYGALKTHDLDFQTTRPPYCGAFILAYAQMMVQQILNIANPEEDPKLQPGPGDTDSLLIPLVCTERLRKPNKNGFVWFPAKEAQPGQLTDELMDTLLTKTDFVKKEDKALYEDKLAISYRWFSPCPKMLAVEFDDPIKPGVKYYKFRSKGISVNSLITKSNDNELMSAGVLFEYAPTYLNMLNTSLIGTGGLNTLMKDKIKRIGPGSVKKEDRNTEGGCKTLFKMQSSEMQRNILSKPWKGRKYIGDNITVPYGYVAKTNTP